MYVYTYILKCLIRPASRPLLMQRITPSKHVTVCLR